MSDHEFHLMQLADSFFPSGMFGLSGGLESFVKSGRIRSRNDVLRIIRNQMNFQLVPFDCAVLSAVMNAAKKGDFAGAAAADNQCYSLKLIKEVRTASTRSGRQLLYCLVHMTSDRFAKKMYSQVETKKNACTYPACLAVDANSVCIHKKIDIYLMF